MWCSTILGWFPCSSSLLGSLLWMLIYGSALLLGAKLISNASELLLEVWPPGIIGGLLLPVLNSGPLCALVVAAGLGGTLEEAQESMRTGMGTLVGTTIMLLSLTWGFSIILGRCDLSGPGGTAVDGMLTRGFDMWHTGGTTFPDVQRDAWIAGFSSATYFLLQVPAWCGSKTNPRAALIGAIVALLAAVLYSAYKLAAPLPKRQDQEDERQWPSKEPAQEAFVEAMEDRRDIHGSLLGSVGGDDLTILLGAAKEGGLATAESAQGSPKERAAPWQILTTAFLLLLAGFALVAVFADPMVRAIENFGLASGLPVFFVSFVISPFASNASEFISSLLFAAHKTKEHLSLALGQVYGAIVLTNTLCLAVFFLLIYLRGLAWDFSAEVVVIVACCAAACSLAGSSTTLRLWMAMAVLALYPLSIAGIAVLSSHI